MPRQTANDDCGQCDACLDKVKFGGTGRMRKGCRAKAVELVDAAEECSPRSAEEEEQGTAEVAYHRQLGRTRTSQSIVVWSEPASPVPTTYCTSTLL